MGMVLRMRLHFKNVFGEGELDANSVVAKNATTTQYGAIKTKHEQRRFRKYSNKFAFSLAYSYLCSVILPETKNGFKTNYTVLA
jgi:hypothetical protein